MKRRVRPDRRSFDDREGALEYAPRVTHSGTIKWLSGERALDVSGSILAVSIGISWAVA